MDNLNSQYWIKRKESLQSGQDMILSQLNRCKMGRNTPAVLQEYRILEEIVVSHISIQSPDFYRALFGHLKNQRVQIKVLEYLEFDLKALRIKLLEFMEKPMKVFVELSDDLTTRIAIEKEYLAPLVELMSNQVAVKQSTYEN